MNRPQNPELLMACAINFLFQLISAQVATYNIPRLHAYEDLRTVPKLADAQIAKTFKVVKLCNKQKTEQTLCNVPFPCAKHPQKYSNIFPKKKEHKQKSSETSIQLPQLAAKPSARRVPWRRKTPTKILETNALATTWSAGCHPLK